MAENERAAEGMLRDMAQHTGYSRPIHAVAAWAVAEIDRLRAERAELLAALESVSQIIGDGFLWGECDECRSADSDGHTSTCKLGKTIRDILSLLARVEVSP